MNDKDSMRHRFHAERDKLNYGLRHELSKKITTHLKQLNEFTIAQTVCIYVSKDSEVCTEDMIKEMIENRTVVVPCTDKKNKTLFLSQLKDWNDLRFGAYGILEPAEDKRTIVQQKEIDIFIVPGLAFSRDGTRLGYGIGYYDKLLQGLKKPKIGLAYSFQLTNDIHAEPHDIKLNKIITEYEVIDAKNT